MPLNLVRDAWIPVLRRSGRRDVIRPAQIAERDDPPMAPAWPRADLDVACLELLIGLVCAATPPRIIEDWREGAAMGHDALEVALAPLAPCFDLDGGGPNFMQDFTPLDGAPNGVDMLFIDAAGGNTAKNNADIMVHRQRYGVLGRAGAAMAIYTLQQFAPSGGAGNRTSMRGGGPMATLVAPTGATLWETLWMNVPYAPEPVDPQDFADVFPWMAPTKTSEKAGSDVHQDSEETHPAAPFFGMPRRLRLVFEDAPGMCDLTGAPDGRLATGVIQRPYGVNYGSWAHPTSPYYAVKAGAGWLPVHPKPGRFSFRNWAGIALRPNAQNAETRRRAACVEAATHGGRLDGDARVQLRVAGWAMDNMKPLDFIDDHAQVYGAGRADEEARAIDLAEAGESAAWAVASYLKSALNADDKGAVQEAREAFYAQAEPAFLDALDALDAPGDTGAESFRKALAAVALGLFEARVSPGLAELSPEHAERRVNARRNLLGFLNGYGKPGREFFGKLGLTPPDRAAKKMEKPS